MSWSQRAYLGSDTLAPSMIALTMLGLAIVVHEIGHLLAGRYLRVRSDSVVLFPFGGLHQLAAPIRNPAGSSATTSPGIHPLWFHLAGPTANLAVGLAILVVGEAVDVSFFAFIRNPLLPSGLIEGSALEVSIRTAVWLQLLLAAINSLPCGPFDGGQAVRFLAGHLHPKQAVNYQQRWLRWGTLATACLLTLLAAMRWDSVVYEPIAFWLPLILTALLLVFSVGLTSRSAWQPDIARSDNAQSDNVSSNEYGESAEDRDYRSAGTPEPLMPSEVEVELEQAGEDVSTEVFEVCELDAILEKIHLEGRERLTAAEEAFLLRASGHFRQRAERPSS
jgi:Zn-dependent protease